ncbi:NARFL isoform 10 [Pan troglodytes]|uniref:Cytosolic iron-sulfur assembly component 3 n=2 Tax=Homininae TaxID=207598 RepID=H3BQ03_HUMAN|nr:cytosolic iron-sulfur assembly component 3 [Homo sapiens]KAI4052669.1 cytosolic iron-sulfur assembly component 3 [Homo sapiens]PNI18983.1 NARFL isoform 10 [Pan troglodytes]
MASPFSGALQLTDLDDFIGPSQIQAHVLSMGSATLVSVVVTPPVHVKGEGVHQACQSGKKGGKWRGQDSH